MAQPSVNGNNMDTTVDQYLGFLDNEYVAAGISLFLVLYAAVIAPKLPPNVLNLFDNVFVQLALFFTIVYVSQKNVTIALVASIAVLVTLMIVNNQITMKILSPNEVSSENFKSCKANMAHENDEQVVLEDDEDIEDMGVPMEIVEDDEVEGLMDEDVEAQCVRKRNPQPLNFDEQETSEVEKLSSDESESESVSESESEVVEVVTGVHQDMGDDSCGSDLHGIEDVSMTHGEIEEANETNA